MIKNIKLILVISIIIALLIIIPTNVQAVLQSNGDSPAQKNISDWMLQVRQMQTTGGTLGLADSVNATGLLSDNKDLDIHMQKNTEYGAMILLSASSYGKPDKINDGETTTGNSTGVVMKINKEWVAAGVAIRSSVNYANASGRYKNTYAASYSPKNGDAMLNWHGSGSAQWFGGYSHTADATTEYSGMVRSCADSVFSYNGNSCNIGPWAGYTFDPFYDKTWASRAVIVVGSGV